MRAIKLALISIVILFAVASLIGMILPSTVLVSRAVNIEAYKDSIRPFVSDMNQWAQWIDGMHDSSVHILSANEAYLAGNHVRITGVTDSTVQSSWVGKNGNEQTSLIRLIGDPGRKITVVQWQFVQRLKWYPWEKLGSMMNDKILGTMMERNLNNLRALTAHVPR